MRSLHARSGRDDGWNRDGAAAMSVLVSRRVLPSLPALGQWAATPLGLSLLATAFLVIATLAGPGPSLSDWLGDTDDAVRLVTVRELIGGAPWFDTTLPRIGAPEPLVSHWSRLIDLPLAALIGTPYAAARAGAGGAGDAHRLAGAPVLRAGADRRARGAAARRCRWAPRSR